MRTYLKDLKPGDDFMLNDSDTMYRAVNIRNTAGSTVVSYVIPTSMMHEWVFHKPSLTSVTTL